MHKDAKTNTWRPRRHALQRCRCAQIRKSLPAWIPRARACGQRQCIDAGKTRDEGTRAHVCTGKVTMHGTPHVNVHTCQQTKKNISASQTYRGVCTPTGMLGQHAHWFWLRPSTSPWNNRCPRRQAKTMFSSGCRCQLPKLRSKLVQKLARPCIFTRQNEYGCT